MKPLTMLARQLTLFILCLSASLLAFQIAVPEDVLIGESESIVIGEVFEESSFWNPEQTLIYTDYKVAVTQRLKGAAPEDTLSIRVLGGTVGDLTLRVSEGISIKAGEEVLLFLSKPEGGSRTLIHDAQGKQTIVEGKIAETGELLSAKLERVILSVNAQGRKVK